MKASSIDSIQAIARFGVWCYFVSLVGVAHADWEVQQIVHSNDVAVSRDGDELRISTTGNDPYLIWQIDGRPEPRQLRILEFEYFSVQSIGEFSAFLGPPITESSHFDLPELLQAEGWQSYAADLESASGKPLSQKVTQLRLDFGIQNGIQFRLRKLRLRERNEMEEWRVARAAEIRKRKLGQDQSIQEYLARDFNRRLNVVVGGETITISCEDTRPMRLVEFPSHQSVSSGGVVCQALGETDGARTTFQVPRFIHGRDRLCSGWRLATINDSGEAEEYLTPRQYSESVPYLGSDEPAKRLFPTSQKGLGGIDSAGPLDDLTQLGIRAITINLVLNGFVTTQFRSGLDRIGGDDETPVYFNPAPFIHYDRLIDFARKNEMVVSAIVLVPRSKNLRSRSILVHPESDGGVYSMPNLVSEDGSQIYAQVLDRIAKRYARSDTAPGAITHWIAHNEIDFHTVWTNMGRQPRRVVTETYYRSMRMIQRIASQYNPHATVFVSLTHHWSVADDGKWQRLAPKEVLQSLQRFSELEGEFNWGVAYHPYPQSLFSTVAWNDRQISDDFDTPLITIQNLQVLGRFLHQPSMRDRHGHVRTVLLSEQGFHTEDYGDTAQQFQAESLSYAMQRIKRMPWIESFHYHRWIDHPDEGGLKLGLRTLPTSEYPHGLRKRSWFVYQATK